MSIQTDLIFDLGVSEGNDTDFYLRKGFRVLGVEADPDMYVRLQERFVEAISSGQLIVLNRAAFSQSGQRVPFFVNTEAQGHSRLITDGAVPARRGERVDVETIAWPDLIAIAGVPYYCKVDIEGAEPEFLASVIGTAVLPTYFSVEMHSLKPVEMLHQIGYQRFRVINQTLPRLLEPPDPPREGKHATPNNHHSSGLFGKELPGEIWSDFAQVERIFDHIKSLRHFRTIIDYAWFDCHATV